jgi:hypothetical protein
VAPATLRSPPTRGDSAGPASPAISGTRRLKPVWRAFSRGFLVHFKEPVLRPTGWDFPADFLFNSKNRFYANQSWIFLRISCSIQRTGFTPIRAGFLCGFLAQFKEPVLLQSELDFLRISCSIQRTGFTPIRAGFFCGFLLLNSNNRFCANQSGIFLRISYSFQRTLKILIKLKQKYNTNKFFKQRLVFLCINFSSGVPITWAK